LFEEERMAGHPQGEGLTILITGGDIDDARRKELASIAPKADIRYFAKTGELEAAAGDAVIVAGSLSEPALARAKKLKWIHSWAAGPDKQLFPAMVTSPVVLTCSKGNGAIPLAEHAIMLMLMLNRNAMRWIESARAHKWDRFVHGELNGLTCGIVGAGYSGADLAIKAKAFHMRVIGLRRQDVPTPNFDRMYDRAHIRDFMAESDFVVVTAPLTLETENMIGEAELRAMKKTAYYVCFSRGGLADDAALYRALKEGWIAGAGLDAHLVEPLPADSPYWDLPNVIVTPHNGATTGATFTRGYRVFVDNLARYVAGEPLFNIVDKQHGY
jgi:phosphoglycerate dehydrogenase-like enzyme